MIGAGGGVRELVFNGDRVSVLEDEKVLEMMVVVPLNCTHTHTKIVRMVNFVMCI